MENENWLRDNRDNPLYEKIKAMLELWKNHIEKENGNVFKLVDHLEHYQNANSCNALIRHLTEEFGAGDKKSY